MHQLDRDGDIPAIFEELHHLRARQTALLDQVAELRVRLDRSERLLDAVGSLWSELRISEALPTSSSDDWLPVEETQGVVSTSGDLHDAVRTLVRMGFGDDGCVGLVVCTLRDERTLEVRTHHGFPHEAIRAFSVMDLDERVPVADAIRSGAAVWLRDFDDLHLRYPHITRPESRAQSGAALPIVVDGRCVGAVGVWFPYPQPFDVVTRSHLIAVTAALGALLHRDPQAPLRPVRP